MSIREQASRQLKKHKPLYRLAATAVHPSHQGKRLSAIGRAVKYEVLTTGFGRPTTIPIGERSHLIGYKGETNSPHAIIRNPPNWPDMLVWKRHLRPHSLFIDVGANIGAYTIYALELGAQVIAVEPVAHNAGRIREHLQLNGYQAEVVEKALSDKPGLVRMTTDEDSYNHLVDAGGVEVEATTLDTLLGDRTASVKVDVEGAEDLVLAGATRALTEHRITLLQLEWAVTERMGISDRSTARDILSDAGYELYLPQPDGGLELLGDRTPPPSLVNVFAMPR